MKLSKMLISSGVLVRGQARHCSEWEISSLGEGSRFAGSLTLRAAALRRAQVQGLRRKESVLQRLPTFFGWKKQA